MEALIFLLGAAVGFGLGIFGACMLAFGKAMEGDHD